MRGPVICGVLLILLFVSASANPVQAAKKEMVLNVALGTLSLAWGGLSYLLIGRVSDLSGSPIANARISIELKITVPIHGTTSQTYITYSNATGGFRDSLLIPYVNLGWDVFVVADKPGYDTAFLDLMTGPRPYSLGLPLLFIIGLVAVYIMLRIKYSRYRRTPHDAATNKRQALIDR